MGNARVHASRTGLVREYEPYVLVRTTQVGVRLWSDDPSLPALHAACERQQQQQQQQPDSDVTVTASQVSLGAGSSAKGADSRVSDAVTAALQQLQEQHAGGSVGAGGSSSITADGGAGAGGPGPARAAQLASLQKCVTKPDAGSVQRPNGSSTIDTTSLDTDADEANLLPVAPACLGAVSFRQQQVEVRPSAAGAGSDGAAALAGSSGTSTPGVGVLAQGCGHDDPAGAAAGSGNMLLLRPGVAFELRVQLHDSTGAPVRAGGRGARRC